MAGRRGTTSASAGENGDSTINNNTNNGGNTVSNDSNASNGAGNKTNQRARRSRSNQNTGTFNPKLILSQMATLQCFHYFILCVFVQTNSVIFATSVTLDRVFTDRYLNIWTAEGWIDNSAVLLSSISGAILLALIVEKAKKCLDFSITMFVIHTILCSLYGGLPRAWDWWIVHLLHMILMILLGEFLCSRREMRDIPLLSL